MTAILLCGYRKRDESEQALFQASVDLRIRELRALGFEVLCVLAGEHADEQLRLCRRIADCELVFDTQDEPNLATNLKAGLAGTDGSGCFVLPVEVPCPPRDVWQNLREHWRTIGFLTETNIYRPAHGAAPTQFPLLVTRSGNASIKEMPDFRSLLDARLKYELATLDVPL